MPRSRAPEGDVSSPLESAVIVRGDGLTVEGSCSNTDSAEVFLSVNSGPFVSYGSDAINPPDGTFSITVDISDLSHLDTVDIRVDLTRGMVVESTPVVSVSIWVELTELVTSPLESATIERDDGLTIEGTCTESDQAEAFLSVNSGAFVSYGSDAINPATGTFSITVDISALDDGDTIDIRVDCTRGAETDSSAIVGVDVSVTLACAIVVPSDGSTLQYPGGLTCSGTCTVGADSVEVFRRVNSGAWASQGVDAVNPASGTFSRAVDTSGLADGDTLSVRADVTRGAETVASAVVAVDYAWLWATVTTPAPNSQIQTWMPTFGGMCVTSYDEIEVWRSIDGGAYDLLGSETMPGDEYWSKAFWLTGDEQNFWIAVKAKVVRGALSAWSNPTNYWVSVPS